MQIKEQAHQERAPIAWHVPGIVRSQEGQVDSVSYQFQTSDPSLPEKDSLRNMG